MSDKIRVFIAGDSTAADKLPEKYPETGWGQVISEFFTQDIVIKNYALNGRSTKSFIEEGHLEQIAEAIEKGDFLFIEFGHNDEKDDAERHTDPFTSYKSNLRKYIETARNAEAFPVLLTPIHRRFFNENGEIENSHGDYPAAMRELASELNVPIIDMLDKSRLLFEDLGPDKTKEIFLWLGAGISVNYPEGVRDNTHFSERGALKISALVVKDILEQKLEPLYRYIIKRD